MPPEKHPQIHEALESLRNAKQHLEHAAHDFGRHRVEAIHAIDEAIHQLEICMQYDKDVSRSQEGAPPKLRLGGSAESRTGRQSKVWPATDE